MIFRLYKLKKRCKLAGYKAGYKEAENVYVDVIKDIRHQYQKTVKGLSKAQAIVLENILDAFVKKSEALLDMIKKASNEEKYWRERNDEIRSFFTDVLIAFKDMGEYHKGVAKSHATISTYEDRMDSILSSFNKLVKNTENSRRQKSIK